MEGALYKCFSGLPGLVGSGTFTLVWFQLLSRYMSGSFLED